MKQSNHRVHWLVSRVKEGDCEAFERLEGIAKPLLNSLACRFSNYHHKFEFEDFYNIALHAMYKACLKFDHNNPSFLDFAKVFVLRELWREIEHWNAEMRNIFDNNEECIEDYTESLIEQDTVFDCAIEGEVIKEVASIIDRCFNTQKARMMKLHLFDDYSIAEIARIEGVKYKNAYSTITRGRDRLAKICEHRDLTIKHYL